MTAKRDLKRRVRERQARTGESYMTALRQVRGPRAGAVPVVEMIDLSEIAAALGIKCRVMISPTLAERVDAAAALRRLCAALTATARDPALELMRSVVLRGEQPRGRPPGLAEGRRFLARVRAGIGGISEHGRQLAIALDSRRGTELVVFLLWIVPVKYITVPPTLVVTSADDLLGEPMLAWR